MDQIEEVRSKIDIVQVISEYITLLKAGSNFKAVCPFHAEKTASMMVSPERQIFKCFGCGKGGSVFNFLMEMEGIDFGEALKVLAKRAGVNLSSYRPTAYESEKEKLYQINHLASEFYHFLLLSHPSGKKALEYLLGRGISRESIEVFKLGYAPPLWDGLIKFLVGKRGYKTDESLKLGLILRSQTGFRDFFHDRLIFPLRDHRGNTVGFTGRTIGTWENKLGPKYLNTHETELYHKGDLLYGLESTKQAIKSAKQAIAVEGQMDLISSYQAGVQNVIAVSGSALTESQCRLLKRFCDTLVLAFDVDLAGDQAARRGIKMAENSGFTIKIAQVPQGKDPDDLIRKNPKEWERVVDEAIGVYDFLLDSAFARWKEKGAEGKKKIGQEVIPIFSQINDEIVKDHYIRLLAQKLQVGEDSILRQMEKTEQGKPIGAKEEEKISKHKTRREILEEYLLAISFQSGQENQILEKNIRKEITLPAFVKIVDLLEEFLEKEKFTSQKFAQSLPSELVEIYNNFYLFDFGKEPDPDWFVHEQKKVLQQMQEIDLREKINTLSSEITQLERQGKTEEMEKAKKEFSSLCQKLAKNTGL